MDFRIPSALDPGNGSNNHLSTPFFKIPHSCCIVTKDSIFIELEQSFRSGIMRPLARFSIFSSYLYISFFHFLFLAFCPEWRLSRHLKADESLSAWRCSCIFFFLLFSFYVPIFLFLFIHSLIVIYLRFSYYNYYFIKKSSALWCALPQLFWIGFFISLPIGKPYLLLFHLFRLLIT